jgi:arylsulfatase A-like enzyme
MIPYFYTIGIMQTFQYANDCLGKFIRQLRQSPLGENTIVVVTGDHSMTGSFIYKDNEFLHRWAVPVAFYIPESYKQKKNINTHRFSNFIKIYRHTVHQPNLSSTSPYWMPIRRAYSFLHQGPASPSLEY